MILCSCNRITEDEVRKAARSGAPTVEAAYACLGCEAQCGCCLDYAQEIIDAERHSGRSHLRLVKSRAA
jgi:bacterioferritin-associated ferredoxin